MFRIIHDVATGEITKVELEGEELKAFKESEIKRIKDEAKIEAENTKKAKEKAELLEKLNLTEADLKLLF